MKQFPNPEIKRENRRAIRIFIPILIVAALLGGGIGVLLSWLKYSPEATSSIHFWTNQIFQAVTPYAILILTVLLMGCAYIFYAKAKRRFRNWDGENETVIEQAENDLSKGLFLSQVNQICSFFFFAAACYISDPFLFLIPLASFLLTIFVVFLFQKQVVDLLKTINPEKHGSIFDFNFNKKWIASCDEAQQLLIYKAAYKAFRIGIYTCLALWLLLFLANMAFDVGLLPIACVSLIWLIITIAYYVESRHLQAGTPSATL